MTHPTPHSPETIREAELRVGVLRANLQEEEDALQYMLQENREAEAKAAVEKARKMTPTMLGALEKLAEGTTITWFRGFGHTSKTRYYFKDSDANVNATVVDRLRIAGYIEQAKNGYAITIEQAKNGYAITDAGRAALKAAKKDKTPS